MTETVERISHVEQARREYASFEIRKPEEGIHRDLQRGWLLPYLFNLDTLLWHRWDWWHEAMLAGRLPERPLPRIEFGAGHDASERRVRKMLEACLNAIPRHGSWESWSGWDYFRYFLNWILFGLGHPGQMEIPDEPAGCDGASDRLYQVFNLDAMMLYPYDYWGDILADSGHGKGNGFFPTPMNITNMMTLMVIGEDPGNATKKVCDPCTGTGRFLLSASNYSVRLYGMDIDPTVLLACLVNGYLYAPWLVKSFPFLDVVLLEPAASGELSDGMVEQAPPHAQGYLHDTEHDGEEQFRFEPLKKRRKKPEEGLLQGVLF